MPVKLTDAIVNGRSVTPQGAGLLVSVPPTIADLEEAEGDPYRKEAHVRDDERPKWEAIFRSVTAIDVSTWPCFDHNLTLLLYFESLVMSPIHIFGFIEGHAPSLDDPMWGHSGPG